MQNRKSLPNRKAFSLHVSAVARSGFIAFLVKVFLLIL